MIVYICGTLGGQLPYREDGKLASRATMGRPGDFANEKGSVDGRNPIAGAQAMHPIPVIVLAP